MQSFFLVVWGAQAEDVVTKFANRSKVDKLVVKLEGAMDLVAKEAVKEWVTACEGIVVIVAKDEECMRAAAIGRNIF